jgi:hypothetical protein
MVFGYSYGWIGLRRDASGTRLVQVLHAEADKQPNDRIVASVDVKSPQVQLRVAVSEDSKCRFSYSTDGRSFTPFGEELQATVARWVGAKVGVFSSLRHVPDGRSTASHVDFDFFRVTP